MAKAVKVGNVQIGADKLSSSTAQKLGVSKPDTSQLITKDGKRYANPNADPSLLNSDSLAKIRRQYGDEALSLLPKNAGKPDSPTGIEDTATPLDQATNGAQAGQLSYEQALQNLNSGGLTGTALSDAQKSLAGSYGQKPPTPFSQAHQQLQASGIAPSDGGQAMSAVQSAKPYQPDQTAVDQVFSQDPVINNLMSSAWDLLSPQNTKGSLMDDYKKLYRNSGLKEINEEMIDAETVINGTEDDIRNEIQTAGGLATDSQVQAMALSRNKNLLKRYNALAEMQTNATNQLNTMLNISTQDRQMAQQRVSAQVSALFNFAQFRQQAQNNIREGFNNLISTVGFSGAYASYAGHPEELKQIESMMGYAPGQLAQLASQPDYNQLMKQTQYQNALLQNQKLQKELAPATPSTSPDQLTFLKNTALDAQGLAKASGTSGIGKFFGDLFQGDSDFRRLENTADTLKTNMLTLQGDPSIKEFFGPQMSDSDSKLMLSGGSTLDPSRQSPAEFKAEAKRIGDLFARMEGIQNGTVKLDADGTHYLYKSPNGDWIRIVN